MWRFFKRIFDIVTSLIIIAILMPLFMLISMVVLLFDGYPVIYKQKRIGLNWKPFYIYKFRTMVKNADAIGLGITSSADDRITPVGKWLRKFKFDELPQFFNVLLGDMSVVGSRPELPKYTELFRQDYNDILKLKPGITDFASITYAKESTILENASDKENAYINEILPEKIILNKMYLSKTGFLTDLLIIFRTIKAILR